MDCCGYTKWYRALSTFFHGAFRPLSNPPVVFRRADDVSNVVRIRDRHQQQQGPEKASQHWVYRRMLNPIHSVGLNKFESTGEGHAVSEEEVRNLRAVRPRKYEIVLNTDMKTRKLGARATVRMCAYRFVWKIDCSQPGASSGYSGSKRAVLLPTPGAKCTR